MKRKCPGGTIALAAAFLTCACTASLSQPAGPGTGEPFALSASLDSVLVLVDLRPAGAVRQDLRYAEDAREAAHRRLGRSKELQRRARMQIELKQSEIGVLEARLALAKSEKNKALEDDLKRQKKMAELEKKLLERREDLREKEIDLAKAEIEHASASRDALERELELAGLREERISLGGMPATPDNLRKIERMDLELRDRQDRTLEARVRAYERLEKVAKQEVSVNKARRNILSAQTKLLESAG